MNFSRHAGQTAQANGQHRVRGQGGGARNFPLVFTRVSPPTFSVSTKGQVGDLWGGVGNFYIRLAQKLVCKWEERWSKVPRLREHVGARVY